MSFLLIQENATTADEEEKGVDMPGPQKVARVRRGAVSASVMNEEECSSYERKV